MNLIRSLFVAFSMYSKIPMPKTNWTKEAMKYAMCFFPLIGVVIGAGMLIWDFLAWQTPGRGSILYSAVMVVIPVAVTGGIHVDGLLDTADALSSYKSREEKLEILKDSHAGAFAIIVGILYFLLAFGIYSQADRKSLQILAVGFILSRAMSGFALVSFPMAKQTGLAALFSEQAVKGRVRIVMAFYIFACAGGMLWIDPVLGGAGMLGAALTFVYYYRMSNRKFGGITGDLAGFFLQICELVMAICVIGGNLVI